MRIALVSNDFWPIFDNAQTSAGGGIEGCVESLVRGMVTRKIDFTLICPKRLNPITCEFEIIETESQPCCLQNPSNYISNVYDILKTIKPKIIWAQSNWSQNFSDIGKTISFIHDGHLTRPANFLVDKPNSYIRYLSYAQKNNLCKYNWEKEKSFVCYTGLPEEEFINYPYSEKSYLLWVGSLFYGINAKGLLDFIELSKRNQDKQFIAYGIGETNIIDYILQITKNIPNFQWRGKLNRGKEHQDVFGKAKFFCQFSHLAECAPRVICESMSKSTGVLALKNNGASEELVSNQITTQKTINELENFINLNYNSLETFNYAKSKFHINQEIDTLIQQSESILTNGRLL